MSLIGHSARHTNTMHCEGPWGHFINYLCLADNTKKGPKKHLPQFNGTKSVFSRFIKVTLRVDVGEINHLVFACKACGDLYGRSLAFNGSWKWPLHDTLSSGSLDDQRLALQSSPMASMEIAIN